MESIGKVLWTATVLAVVCLAIVAVSVGLGLVIQVVVGLAT